MYTENNVERLLKSYLDIKSTLAGNTQNVHDAAFVTGPTAVRERPFGHSINGPPWPFMEQRHARTPRDGKAKARFLEELLCGVIDIETVFHKLSDDDQELLLKYLVTQGYTLDELIAERGTVSRGSMRQRIQRAVARLTRLMNGY